MSRHWADHYSVLSAVNPQEVGSSCFSVPQKGWERMDCVPCGQRWEWRSRVGTYRCGARALPTSLCMMAKLNYINLMSGSFLRALWSALLGAMDVCPLYYIWSWSPFPWHCSLVVLPGTRNWASATPFCHGICVGVSWPQAESPENTSTLSLSSFKPWVLGIAP